jgi:hypothetical protein
MSLRLALARAFFASTLVLTACSSSSTPGGQGGAGQSTSAPAQKLAVGSPCAEDTDCGTAPFFCQKGDHQGGYCMRGCDIAKGDADCPSEAICQYDGKAGECHKKCDAKTDCRDGYVCSPASSDASDKASHAFCDAADMAGMGGAGQGGAGMAGMGQGGMNMGGGGMGQGGMNMGGSMK